jgi:hypothetical protein
MNFEELKTKIKIAQEKRAKEAEKQSRIFKLEFRIGGLKSKLQATDYKAIKYAEGELSAEEYAETREQRKAWRAEINALEAEIKAIKEGANEN